jgi:hypothetical protein
VHVGQHVIEVFQAKRRQADINRQIDAMRQSLVGEAPQRGLGFGQVAERVVGAP